MNIYLDFYKSIQTVRDILDFSLRRDHKPARLKSEQITDVTGHGPHGFSTSGSAHTISNALLLFNFTTISIIPEMLSSLHSTSLVPSGKSKPIPPGTRLASAYFFHQAREVEPHILTVTTSRAL
jgi:hypothetical protein